MKLDSKYFDRIRTRRRKDREPEIQTPTCQWDGCEKPGAHRAPVGRHAEGQFFMFCFEHVKDYNKGYNYFSGLSDAEIARYYEPFGQWRGLVQWMDVMGDWLKNS